MPAGSELRWRLVCAAAVLPLSAILHHVVFFPKTCMLNPFWKGGDGAWLRLLGHDPALPVAFFLALLLFGLGRALPAVRSHVALFGVAFAPLALWLWDLPFSERVIHAHLHDLRVVVHGVALQSRHFYALGVVLYVGLLLARRWTHAAPGSGSRATAAKAAT
jgi:hypothetical protein